MEVRTDNSLFVNNDRNAGRAYRDQAMELIKMCRVFTQAAPELAHEDAEQRRQANTSFMRLPS
jgi:hypothetical protein